MGGKIGSYVCEGCGKTLEIHKQNNQVVRQECDCKKKVVKPKQSVLRKLKLRRAKS